MTCYVKPCSSGEFSPRVNENSQTQQAAGPTGRTAPQTAGTKPLNGQCGRGALLAVQASVSRICHVNCGCIYKLRAPHITWGEADATHSLRKAFFCSVQPGCVHDRERPRDSSVIIPAHFASILVPFPHRETCSLTKEQTKRHRQLMRTRQGDSGGHTVL